jgi:hydrogenase maturation factor
MCRHILALFATALILPTLIAQQPLKPPTAPTTRANPQRGEQPSNEPNRLPNTVTEIVVQTPQRENLNTLDTATLVVARFAGEWVVTHGGFTFKTFGEHQRDAQAVLQAFRELAPNQWGTIGTGATLVEYGLAFDADQRLGGAKSNARMFTPIDRDSLRMEFIRGSSIVRDHENLLLNFGSSSQDAQQAIAVIKKYGFNAVGTAGQHRPMTYLFTTTARITSASAAKTALSLAAQEHALKHTSLMLPSVGIVGEQIAIDPRKLEVKRIDGQATVVHGTDVILKFGVDEWNARDAQRILRDAKLTEVCPFGTQGLSLFLSNGRPLRAMPIATRSARFDVANLRVLDQGGRWCVADSSARMSLPAGSREEAERLLKVIRELKFDLVCTLAYGTRHAVTVLAQDR